MSSSSSTDVDSEGYFCGEINHPTPWPMHPLIYYTTVPNRRKQRSNERKKQHSNCFAKAFRWYTQERNPCQRRISETRDPPDIRGFAMWLDEKYTEYLQENQGTKGSKQTSSAEIDEVSNNLNACDSCSTKRKFKVLKSPRKRHRKLTNSKDRETVLIRSNKSFEYILQPKNVSRAASEIPRQVSRCTNSTATIVKAKSQSLTSILVEKEVYSFPYDTAHTDNEDKADKERDVNNNVCDGPCSVTQPTPKQQHLQHPQQQQQKQQQQQLQRRQSVSCQCLGFEGVPSQHRPKSSQRKPNIICACEKFIPPPQDQLKQLDQKLSPCKCPDSVQICPTTCLRHNDAKTKTMSAKCSNDGTQTADYPINLATAQRPLLMKIVCTNKI